MGRANFAGHIDAIWRYEIKLHRFPTGRYVDEKSKLGQNGPNPMGKHGWTRKRTDHAEAIWSEREKDMARKKFFLVGKVSTDNPAAISIALRKVVPKGIIEQTARNEFLVKAEFRGENARDLNRSLLSELRRVERATRLRSEWTSGTQTERFFDYVPKSKTLVK